MDLIILLSHIIVTNEGENPFVDRLYNEWVKLNHDYHNKKDVNLNDLKLKVSKTIPRFPYDAIMTPSDIMSHQHIPNPTPDIITTAVELNDINTVRFNRGILFHGDRTKIETNVVNKNPRIEFHWVVISKSYQGYMCSQSNGTTLYRLGYTPLDFSDSALGIVTVPSAPSPKIVYKVFNNITISDYYEDTMSKETTCEHIARKYRSLLKSKYIKVHEIKEEDVYDYIEWPEHIYMHRESKLVYFAYRQKTSKFNYGEVGNKGSFINHLFNRPQHIRFSIIPLVIFFDDNDEETHRNLIVVDHVKKEVYRLEPHGSVTETYPMSTADSRFVAFFDMAIKRHNGVENAEYKYVIPTACYDVEGPQLKADVSEYPLLPNEYDGYCIVWNYFILFTMVMEQHSSLSPITCYNLLCNGHDLVVATRLRKFATWMVKNIKPSDDISDLMDRVHL